MFRNVRRTIQAVYAAAAREKNFHHAIFGDFDFCLRPQCARARRRHTRALLDLRSGAARRDAVDRRRILLAAIDRGTVE